MKSNRSDVLERVEVIRSGAIPTALEKALVAGLGGYDNASLVLQEMENFGGLREEAQHSGSEIRMSAFPLPHHLATQAPIGPGFGGNNAVPRPLLKPATSSEIEPDSPMRRWDLQHLAETRRNGLVPYEDIERMQQSAPCVLAARMKKAPLVSAVTGERKWTLKSSDRKLAAVATANARKIFVRHIQDMLEAMDYGSAFGSTVWELQAADQIGVDEAGIGKGTEWYVVDKIQWAHPDTVTTILRDLDYGFAGFQHRRMHKNPSLIVIPPGQALLLTYNGRYGNLYGRSMYEPVYNDWFWYEIVLRDFLRYLQRMGVPVAVCYAPQKGMVTRPDNTEVNAMEYALLIAGYAASHSGLAMPSDTDQNGKPLWRLEYLPADQRGDQFIKALQYFATQISRGIIVGDQTATQDTEVGGFASAQVRDKNTQIDTDMIFQNFLTQIDAYWMMNYGRFNRDFNNPPSLHMVAEVLDPLERESLMKLFATAGNVKIGDGTPLDRIDWNAALRGVHAPVLTEEQLEEQRQKVLENKKEAQEMFQETQAKANGGPPGTAQGGPPGPGQPKGGPQPPSKKLQARLDIIDHLAGGGSVPVMLTLDDVVGIADGAASVLDVGLEGAAIELQNPHHDKRGRFAEAKGFATSPGAELLASVVGFVASGVVVSVGNEIGSRKIGAGKKVLKEYRGRKDEEAREARAKARAEIRAGEKVMKISGVASGTLAVVSIVGFNHSLGRVTEATAQKHYRNRQRKKSSRSAPDTKSWPKDATQNQFRNMYRQLAKKHHPDLGGNKAAMQKINEAYSSGDWDLLEKLYSRILAWLMASDGIMLARDEDELATAIDVLFQVLLDFIRSDVSYIVFEGTSGWEGGDIPRDENGDMVLDKGLAAVLVAPILDAADKDKITAKIFKELATMGSDEEEKDEGAKKPTDSK